jgi:hypothetical protein
MFPLDRSVLITNTIHAVPRHLAFLVAKILVAESGVARSSIGRLNCECGNPPASSINSCPVIGHTSGED